MKIKLNIELVVLPETYAEAYDDYYDKRTQAKIIKEDALHCAEQALADWFHRIGFAGCVVDPQHIDQVTLELMQGEWNAWQETSRV